MSRLFRNSSPRLYRSRFVRETLTAQMSLDMFMAMQGKRRYKLRVVTKEQRNSNIQASLNISMQNAIKVSFENALPLISAESGIPINRLLGSTPNATVH